MTTSTEWKNGIDNNSYGIIFGAQGSSNSYSFGISAIGNYVLWKYTNGSYSYPIPYTPSSEIKSKGKNILTVVKNHDVIELYINYTKVNEITLTDFFGDEIEEIESFKSWETIEKSLFFTWFISSRLTSFSFNSTVSFLKLSLFELKFEI